MGLHRVLSLCMVFGFLKEGCPAHISILIPEIVPAVLGSCVVIPCHFTIPTSPRHTDRQPVKYHVHLRYRFLFGKRTAFSSDDTTEVHRHFKGRTALVGDPSQGDCSLQIDKLRMNDGGRYEMELKEKGASEWTVSKAISITVSGTPPKPEISDPGTIIEGQLVTLNCTVSNSCPDQPVQVLWNWERGASHWHQEQRLLPQVRGQLQVLLSSLSFNASHTAPPWVKCLTTLTDRQRAFTTRNLHIRFPPRDIAIQVLSQAVQEGGSAFLSCSCKADPPVTEYQWFYTHQGLAIDLPQRLQTVRVYNVTRGKRFHCTATNQIGWAKSTPVTIDVQRQPVISQSSSCSWAGGGLMCQCVVDSNPRSAVTWSVDGSNSLDGYNTSVLAQDNPLVAVLRRDMGLPLSVVCYAHNMLGNDSAMLMDRSEDSLLWKVIFVASIFLSLLLLILLFLLLLHYSRKKKRHILNYGHPAVHQTSLGLYHEHTSLYINCTEVTHIYTNGSYQLVYQNCTPIFIQNKQRRQRGRQVDFPNRAQREMQSPSSDTETAIYVEII
ncbi:sialic acid-binding Ig-like lectin 13 isoform X1 [Paramormyrops kingsleyae]|uniref:B-cell receptor CD22-like n=1 Tax=Paramormyrops kingsleyae TaxID=1676925 RepID=A0A3B3QMH7_9TELE|nr:B-cell receptor CD22-like [Paramormyrops kingsleyae]